MAGITSLPRVAKCGKFRIEKGTDPAIRATEEGVAHFTGIQMCGAVHVCTVCGPRIRQERATDIDLAAQRWIEAHGIGTLLFITSTMPHDHGEALAALLDTVKQSFGAMVSGRAWQTDKKAYGIAHYIVAHDSTVGANGWHPHLHELMFTTAALDDAAITRLEDRFHKRWSRAVKKRGHRAPSREHGITIERARNRHDVARYVCQIVAGDALDDRKTVPIALEVARGDLKSARNGGQRTPWQLLADLTERRARDGEWTAELEALDSWDLGLWREWERAIKGTKAIRWSRGLRAAVGLGAERTDEEITATEVGGTDVYRFKDAEEWAAIATTPGARAKALRAAENGGAAEVSWYVTETVRAWRTRRLRHGNGKPPPDQVRQPRPNGHEKTMRALALRHAEAQARAAFMAEHGNS